MDEFVVLTEIYGLKPRVKSAPMAALKRSVVNPNSVSSCHFDSGDDANAELTSNYSKFDDFVVFDELNKLFTNDSVDDLLGDLAGLSPKAKSLNQNISGSMGENEDGFDDLIPGFGGNGQPSNSKFQETEAVEVKKQHFGVDDLDSLFIPGPRSSSVPDSWGAKKPVAPAQFLDDFFHFLKLIHFLENLRNFQGKVREEDWLGGA